MTTELSTFASYTSFLPIVSFILSALAVIVGLNIVWRVEGQLDRVMKWLTVAVGVGMVRKFLSLLGLKDSVNWPKISWYFEIVGSFLVLVAFLKMYKLVRALGTKKK